MGERYSRLEHSTAVCSNQYSGITAEGATNLVGLMPSDDDQRRRLAEQLGPHSCVATPAAIAFEATKQRKLQEAVDEAVHREVAGVLSDLVSIVAAREEPAAWGRLLELGRPTRTNPHRNRSMHWPRRRRTTARQGEQ